MQVFVRRSSLTLAANEAVDVMMYFEDSVILPPETQRPDFTLLKLPGGALKPSTRAIRELEPGWREAYRKQISAGEAERRILAAFPDYQQRNSAAELMGYVSNHGANSATWPREAQQRKAEIDRAWTYVNAVRRASDGMLAGALPADPTADSHWPTRMSAYRSG